MNGKDFQGNVAWIIKLVSRQLVGENPQGEVRIFISKDKVNFVRKSTLLEEGCCFFFLGDSSG